MGQKGKIRLVGLGKVLEAGGIEYELEDMATIPLAPGDAVCAIIDKGLLGRKIVIIRRDLEGEVHMTTKRL